MRNRDALDGDADNGDCLMRMSVNVPDDVRKRIKTETDKTKRPALYEAGILIQEALDARDRKGG